jgi:hypothetical protein
MDSEPEIKHSSTKEKELDLKGDDK